MWSQNVFTQLLIQPVYQMDAEPYIDLGFIKIIDWLSWDYVEFNKLKYITNAVKIKRS